MKERKKNKINACVCGCKKLFSRERREKTRANNNIQQQDQFNPAGSLSLSDCLSVLSSSSDPYCTYSLYYRACERKETGLLRKHTQKRRRIYRTGFHPSIHVARYFAALTYVYIYIYISNPVQEPPASDGLY